MYRIPLLLCCTLLFACASLSAQDTNAAKPSTTARDGSHDFDFEDGSWKIHLKRRLHPLTGSNEWIEFDGTSTTQKLWDGAAHLEQFPSIGSRYVQSQQAKSSRPLQQQMQKEPEACALFNVELKFKVGIELVIVRFVFRRPGVLIKQSSATRAAQKNLLPTENRVRYEIGRLPVFAANRAGGLVCIHVRVALMGCIDLFCIAILSNPQCFMAAHEIWSMASWPNFAFILPRKSA